MFRFAAPRQGKPMAYPYTLLAKVSQFNLKYNFKTNWPFRYSLYGFAVVLPFVYMIDSMVNSPAAKKAYKQAKHAEHKKHQEEHRWADISGRYASR